MKFYSIIFAVILVRLAIAPINAQDIDCKIKIDTQLLPSEARENLNDFVQQIEQYINSYRWTDEDAPEEKISCTIDIQFQGSPRDNHYIAQAFIGSQRPIYKSERNTAIIRIFDDKWEFDYIPRQPLTHSDYRFDPLLSFIDFYMYIILGFDYDTYGPLDGTRYFQNAFEIVSKARGASGAGKGWEISAQSIYQRGTFIDELLNAKFRDFREAVFRYHYRGLDYMYRDPQKAAKNIFSALEKIAKVHDNVNHRSLAIKLFFETKYFEIAETFLNDPDKDIYAKLSKIDQAHQKTYDEYNLKRK